MIEKTGNFHGVGDLKLHYQAWLPDEPPHTLLAVVHGVGEHIGRYQNLVQALVPAGFVLMGYDQRGHGRSEGQRGHINSWEEYRLDLDAFLGIARSLIPDRPLFLYGHSMGSLVVLDYLIDHSAGLAGAIISGTALDPADAAPPLLVLVAKALSGIYPRFKLRVKLGGESLSRNPRVAAAYMDDPLVHWERSARWGAESLRVIERIKSHAGQIQLPILFLHGESDPLLTSAGARAFANQIHSTDKTLCVYPGGLHEPHNDLCSQQAIADMCAWMQAHLAES